MRRAALLAALALAAGALLVWGWWPAPDASRNGPDVAPGAATAPAQRGTPPRSPWGTSASVAPSSARDAVGSGREGLADAPGPAREGGDLPGLTPPASTPDASQALGGGAGDRAGGRADGGGSPTGSMPTRVTARLDVVNTCARPVELRWVDWRGAERTYRTIAPGARATQDTYAMHLWRLYEEGTLRRELALPASMHAEVKACDGPDAQLRPVEDSGFVPYAPERSDGGFLACTPAPRADVPGPCSQRGEAGPATLVLVDDCALEAVELAWVDFDCHERSYARLGPGEVVRQRTFAGHRWRVRWSRTGQLLQEFAAGPGTLELGACGCPR